MTQIGRGDLVGEIEVLAGGPRTANVFAEGPVTALRVPRDAVIAALEADSRAAMGLIEVLASRFREMMTEGGAVPEDKTGDMEALQGVAQFPARVKCAMLSWNVLEQAMNEGARPGEPIIVEDTV